MKNTKYAITHTKKKYNGVKVRQIRALIDIPRYDVKAGDLGGWIQHDHNLDEYGSCWISEDAVVYGDSRVYIDAHVHGRAFVHGDSSIGGRAEVYGNAEVCNADIVGHAKVYDKAKLSGSGCSRPHVSGFAEVCGLSVVVGNAPIERNVIVFGPEFHLYNQETMAKEFVCGIVDDKRAGYSLSFEKTVNVDQIIYEAKSNPWYELTFSSRVSGLIEECLKFERLLKKAERCYKYGEFREDDLQPLAAAYEEILQIHKGLLENEGQFTIPECCNEFELFRNRVTPETPCKNGKSPA